MPIYEYKGQQYDLSDSDPAAAKAKIQAYLKETPEIAVPDVRSEEMATTEGGAAVGMPRRGRAAEVQPTTPLEATAQGVFKGAIVNPALAVTQVAGGEQGRKYVQGIQDQYAQARQEAGLTGFDVPELIGAIASPVNKFLPGGGYTGGAAGAVLQPLDMKDMTTWDVLTGKAAQAAGGALLGRFAENVISGLTPKLEAGAAELIAKGVPVSPGQAYGGAPGWLFRQMESFGLGPKASTVNKAFNTVVADDVLSTIDKTVPKTVKPGQQAVAYVQKQISNFYDDALAGLGKNKFDDEYKAGMNTILKGASQDIQDESTRKMFTNSLNANIGRRIEKDGISGESIKKVQEWLKERIAKYKDSTDINGIGLKTAYGDTLANLNQFVSRIDVDGNIGKADAAWAKLYGFADASKKATTQEGVFKPAQLAEAVTGQAPTLLAAGGGKAPLNELAQTGVRILGNQEPPTLLKGLMLGSKALTGSALAYASGPISIPILMAAGASYAVAKQLMKEPSKARLVIQKALEKNPGMFGAAGSELTNQLLRNASGE